MNKKWKLTAVGLTFTAWILTGCGTANDEAAEETKVVQPVEQSTDNETKTDTETSASTTDTAEEPKADESKADDEEVTLRILEQNINYTWNGEGKEETAFLQNSDNQEFSFYVLPNFELTAEEPGKDLIFLSDQDQFSMRIEILPEDVIWDDVEENVKTQLSSISENVKVHTPEDLSVENGIVYEAVDGDNYVTTVLLKDAAVSARLTIFTDKDNDYRSAFLEMGKTILKN